MADPFKIKKDADFKDTRKRRRPVRTKAGEVFDRSILLTIQERELLVKALAFRALDCSDEVEQIKKLVEKLRGK